MSGPMRIWVGVLFLGLPLCVRAAPLNSRNCEIIPLPPSLVGQPAEFSLQCDAGADMVISWSFGDGTELEYLKDQETVQHVYTAAGKYTVFARFEGELFPASYFHTVAHAPTDVKPTHSSTIVLDSRGILWAVNSDNNSVAMVDASTAVRIKEIPVGRNPTTLALDAQGNLWVVNQNDAKISILSGTNGALLSEIRLPYASKPFGICMDPDGATAYVTLEATGKLLKIDVTARSLVAELNLFPTARGIAVSHDGTRILVTRWISPKSRGEVAEVNGSNFQLVRIHALAVSPGPDSESDSRGVPNALTSVTISPDGRRAWLPSKKDNTGKGLFLDGTEPTFETTVRTIVSQIDLTTNSEDLASRIDLDNRSLATAVVFNSLGDFAFIASQASNHIDIRYTYNGQPATSIEPTGLASELAPRGLVLHRDSLLYVHYFMSREIGVYDVSQVSQTNLVSRLALIPTVESEALAPQVLLGKRIFYNASDRRMSKDGYVSCVVCHLDGGSDGRVWDFTNRGEGLRKTHSLLGRAGMGHGPVHHTANFDEIQDFEHDIRGPQQGEGFMSDALFNDGTRNQPLGSAKAGHSPELDALTAYVTSLIRVNPSPFRASDGSMTADALVGKTIFASEETGCAKCHTSPHFTDSRLPGSKDKQPEGPTVVFSGALSRFTAEGFLIHDVGTLKPASGTRLGEPLRGIDSPTLKGIWETPPYLHDGSAPTLMDVITTSNPNDKHGKTSHLSQREKEQLVAYLLQLDETDDNGVLGLTAPRPVLTSAPRFTARRQGNGWIIEAAQGSLTEPAHLSIFDMRGRLLRRLPPTP